MGKEETKPGGAGRYIILLWYIPAAHRINGSEYTLGHGQVRGKMEIKEPPLTSS